MIEGDGGVATVLESAATTINGRTVAAGSDGHIVVGGTSYTIPRPTAGADAFTASSATTGFAMEGEVTLPWANTTLVVPDGSNTVIDGTTYSARSSGGVVIVHGNSTTLTMDAVVTSTQSLPLVVTALSSCHVRSS